MSCSAAVDRNHSAAVWAYGSPAHLLNVPRRRLPLVSPAHETGCFAVRAFSGVRPRPNGRTERRDAPDPGLLHVIHLNRGSCTVLILRVQGIKITLNRQVLDTDICGESECAYRLHANLCSSIDEMLRISLKKVREYSRISYTVSVAQQFPQNRLC